jgi:hypothetical protein
MCVYVRVPADCGSGPGRMWASIIPAFRSFTLHAPALGIAIPSKSFVEPALVPFRIGELTHRARFSTACGTVGLCNTRTQSMTPHIWQVLDLQAIIIITRTAFLPSVLSGCCAYVHSFSYQITAIRSGVVSACIRSILL